MPSSLRAASTLPLLLLPLLAHAHLPSSRAPLFGVGSAEDIAGARARAAGVDSRPRDPAAAAAAAALVAPLRTTIANTTYCKAALLQYEFVNALLPARAPLLDAFESLLLDVECGATPPSTDGKVTSSAHAPRPLPGAGWTAKERAERCTGVEITVDARRGVDSEGRGTRALPLRTIGAAVSAVRAAAASGSRPAGTLSCIVLRGGTHFLDATVSLSHEDSGLAFVADADDADPSWISGGVPLEGLPAWVQKGTVPTGEPVWSVTLPPAFDNIVAMPSLNSFEPLTRLSNAQWPNYDIETESAEVNGPWGGGGAVSEWVKPAPFPRPTVFWHNLTGLKNDSTMDCYNNYATGTGGPCLHWKGDMGGSGNFYCGNSSGGGWVEVDALMESIGLLLYPIAMVANTSVLQSQYNKTFDAWQIPPFSSYASAPTLTVWMGAPGGGGGWYNNRFAITGYDRTTATMNLSLDGIWPAGGWQGGRTWHTLDAPQGTHNGPMIGGSWHVNGIAAELDVPGEYFFDPTTRELLFVWNTSLLPPGQPAPPPGSPPPASLILVAPQLEVFFNLTGTPQNPVSDVSFVGLGFRDQRDSMLEDWVIPSGGDWALRRAGAITLRGTERALVSACAFVRTDGTAVHIDKYSRNATIEDSEFVWLGMSAVTLLGDTVEDDATAGTQPWGTLLARNLVHEIGILEKQSSALFVDKSALTRAEDCVFFNGPRAMVNINSYMGGGDNYTSNAMWNTCRESGDHGPMNSWNRIPFATRFASGGGEASYRGLHSETANSYIFANYGGSQAFDNDDGSAFFYTHDNAFYMADAFKMDYGGHDSIFSNNVVALRHYDGQACFNQPGYVPGYESTQFGNICVLPPQGSGNDPDLVDSNLGGAACTGGGPGTAIIHNNSYYTASGRATAACGNGSTVSVLDLPPPVEANATVGTIPDDDTLISWFRSKLTALGA